MTVYRKLRSEVGSATILSTSLIVAVFIILSVIIAAINLFNTEVHLQNISNIIALSVGSEKSYNLDGCKMSTQLANLNDSQIIKCDAKFIGDANAITYNHNDFSIQPNEEIGTFKNILPDVEVEIAIKQIGNDMIKADSIAKTSDIKCYL